MTVFGQRLVGLIGKPMQADNEPYTLGSSATSSRLT